MPMRILLGSGNAVVAMPSQTATPAVAPSGKDQVAWSIAWHNWQGYYQRKAVKQRNASSATAWIRPDQVAWSIAWHNWQGYYQRNASSVSAWIRPDQVAWSIAWHNWQGYYQRKAVKQRKVVKRNGVAGIARYLALALSGRGVEYRLA